MCSLFQFPEQPSACETLDQHALCMLCYKDPDPDQRLKVTVKLGKDYSPTVMIEHMMHHHKQEYASVVIDNFKGQSLPSFTGGSQEPRVMSLLEGSGSIVERPEQMSNPGNPEGVALFPAFMARYAALAGSFQSRSCAEKSDGYLHGFSKLSKFSSPWMQEGLQKGSSTSESSGVFGSRA